MSESQLPERPSLEFLRKLAKERLRTMRAADRTARLADALLAVAREHGFSSWRALKAEVDARLLSDRSRFFDACAAPDIGVVREMLAVDPALASVALSPAAHGGWTALHQAARHGRGDVVRLLLAAGADPNAREEGDNTCPLHWAAARGDFDVMGALLDAGADPHGTGADHAGDVIGWGTLSEEPGKDVRQVADFLVARGAHHSVFSALVIGDTELVRSVVEHRPEELDRRLSKFEHWQTPLHFAVARGREDLVTLLIELGADVEAEDLHGQTPLARAIASNNRLVAERLEAAGARRPRAMASMDFRDQVARLAEATPQLVPMISVADVDAALRWFVSIGFTEIHRVEDSGIVNWGLVRFGRADVMLSMHGQQGRQPVSLWFYTQDVDALYALFKARQMADHDAVHIHQDIYNPVYGGREFGVTSPDGYQLYFRRV